MNFKRIIVVALVAAGLPAYGMNKSKDLFKYWASCKYIKKDFLSLNKESEIIRITHDKKKQVPLFEYIFKNGKRLVSFFNHTSPFVHQVTMYFKVGEKYSPVAANCVGTTINEVLSQTQRFSPNSRYSKSDDEEIRLEACERLLVIARFNNSLVERTVIGRHTKEYPFSFKKDHAGKKNKNLDPYYKEAVLNGAGEKIYAITCDQEIVTFTPHRDYHE